MMYLICYIGTNGSLILLEAYPSMELAIDALNTRVFPDGSHGKSNFYIIEAFKFRVK